jgi:DNA (cytosine-5)-methyltransferase 1
VSATHTFGSLFSGVGGMALGLERAGWACRWQVEIDPYCRRVLMTHWPDVPKYGDIRLLSGDDIERVDLIAGGFPCQPVSLAGKRRAQSDDRWLWPEFARIIREIRPRCALLENVPGLLTSGMGDVLGDLASLGYDAEWSVLSACALGAPHTRERVFVVAYTSGIRWDGRRSIGESAALLETGGCSSEHGGAWATNARPAGVGYGVPNRVDRLRGGGNAVVPQVAEWIGRRLLSL